MPFLGDPAKPPSEKIPALNFDRKVRHLPPKKAGDIKNGSWEHQKVGRNGDLEPRDILKPNTYGAPTMLGPLQVLFNCHRVIYHFEGLEASDTST